MPRIKFTKTLVESIKPGDQDIIIKDSATPGLWLKVTPTGHRIYLFYYRNAAGQQRKPKIGEHGAGMTLEDARKKADQWRGDVARGIDPSADRAEKRTVPTLAEFAEIYKERWAKVHKKASSLRADETLIKNHIEGRKIGKGKMDAVSTSEIQALHDKMTDSPVQANRLLALLSKMFNVAKLWGFVARDNPCQGVRKFKETARKRFMSADEVASLAAALNDCEKFRLLVRTEESEGKRPLSQSAIDCLRLIMLTGCRSGEIKNLRWDEIDLLHQHANLSDSKTGAKTVYLNKAAVALLDHLPRVNEWCFPGVIEGQPIQELKTAWRRVCIMAKLKDLRIHDLRHSFASVGASAGLALPILGALLGHRVPSTTARYAHLSNDPLRQASDLIGEEIEKMINGKTAEVVSIAPAPAAKSEKAVSVGA